MAPLRTASMTWSPTSRATRVNPDPDQWHGLLCPESTTGEALLPRYQHAAVPLMLSFGASQAAWDWRASHGLRPSGASPPATAPFKATAANATDYSCPAALLAPWSHLPSARPPTPLSSERLQTTQRERNPWAWPCCPGRADGTCPAGTTATASACRSADETPTFSCSALLATCACTRLRRGVGSARSRPSAVWAPLSRF